uniref:Cytochrome c oxidase subunit 3 n=1 Tax=Blastobotrys adeninivorans TaxID=409370 RepID=A0A060RCV0_BLAAD
MTDVKDMILKTNDTQGVIGKFNRDKYQIFPYHLVEVSPWPIFTAFSIFGLTFNFALIMHGYIGIVNIFWLNIICLTYSICLWVRDVVTESTYLGWHTLAVRRGINIGFILFIVSEALFFAGVFWAYGHSALAPTVELGAVWPPVNIEAIGPLELPLLNTIILLASGATITHSHHTFIAGYTNNIKTSNRNAALISLGLTILLALIFSACQYIEYTNAAFTISDGVFGSVFYLGTGLHATHIITGTMFLSVAFWRMYAYHFTETHHVGYETTILMWHFLDVVWLILFVFFYWWGS